MIVDLRWQEIERLEKDNCAAFVTERAPVPGGWLVRMTAENSEGELFFLSGMSITFVPDPDHVWGIS